VTLARQVLSLLAANRVDILSGVPCSSMGALVEAAITEPSVRYIGAANEGDAVAIGVGAWLATGAPAAVLLQNSGLGNAVNPLTSLVATIEAPLLLFVGWRGGPNTPDEPQHALMGAITPAMLELCGARVFRTGDHAGDVLEATKGALQWVLSGHVGAVLVENVGLSKPFAIDSLDARAAELATELHDFLSFSERPARADILRALLALAPPSAAIVSTTGKCSRELFAINDRDQHFYQVGSMGCASSVGLGIAARTEGNVIVVDGDGAALMRLGAMSTIAAEGPANLIHILLDNEVHDSTGGQPTNSFKTDLSSVAAACGYPTVARCDSTEGFGVAFSSALASPGVAFIHAKIRRGSMEPLGRPDAPPASNARRFRRFMEAARG